MTAQDTHALFRSDEWCVLDSRNVQGTFLYEFCQIDARTRFNSRDIGIIFNIREDHVRLIHHKALIKKKATMSSTGTQTSTRKSGSVRSK
jgi:hypothetical protein